MTNKPGSWVLIFFSRWDNQQVSWQGEGSSELSPAPDRLRRQGGRRDDGAELVAAEAASVAQQGEHRADFEAESGEGRVDQLGVARHRLDADRGWDEREHHQQEQGEASEPRPQSKQET